MNKHMIGGKTINRTEVDRALSRKFHPKIEALEKASSRIIAWAARNGGNSPAAMAWLLKFMQTDFQTLKAWQQEEVQWEATRFALDGGLGLDLCDIPWWRFGSLRHPPEIGVLQELQIDCMIVLDTYMAIGKATFPIKEGSFRIVNGEFPLHYDGEDLASGFYYMAAQLLSKYGPRVKFCEGCTRIMLKGRKDQRFHSQSCQIACFNRKQRAKKKAARVAKAMARQSSRKRKTTTARNYGGQRHAKNR